MPTGDEKALELYIDGSRIGTLPELPELILPETEVDSNEQQISRPEPVEITFKARISPQNLLSIFTGRHLSNNWFKLHGGVMRRKRREGRRK